MYEDEFICLTEDEEEKFIFRKDKKEIYKPYSETEKVEVIRIEKILNIFNCKNETERDIFKKVNAEILRKKLFSHYTFLPINVFIYVLFENDIIIFDKILFFKLDQMFNIKKSSIKKKNSKFCETLKIEEIYRKNQKMLKYLNGYYYLITSNNDNTFIDTESFEYFDMIIKIKKFMSYRFHKYQIITPEDFFFENLYIFNKIMMILQYNDKISKNFNFSVYNKIVSNIISVKFYNEIYDLINKKYVKFINKIIN